ncbi:MAG: PQQ-dependent sugar dehydrogenase [Chloroflexota bacterium]
MKKVILFLTLSLILAACGLREDGITATPPIAEPAAGVIADSETSTVEEPETSTSVDASSEENGAANEETAVSAEETAPPTPTAVSVEEPTPLPTDDPEPTAVPATAIQLVSIASGFFKPVFLTHAFDARLFVVEQHGVINIIKNGQVLDTPFLDIQQRVGSDSSEQGLLSVAFHPSYGENGRFFVNYTNNDGDTIISRFNISSDANQGDPASEQIILTLPQPFPNHNGGQVAFGPDGYLYIGMGDGGAANDPLGNGQDLTTLQGAILRIDVNSGDPYAVPANNPFVSDDGVRNEIWSYGWRNPWRFSFDRLTGGMFIADVGQNTWEEVHFEAAGVAGGANYGWNIMEGNHCFSGGSCDETGLVPPIFEVNHDEGHCSITGGYVYRGQQSPALTGNYFVGDFCSGAVWSLFAHGDGSWTANEVGRSGALISSFGEDVNGELYLLDHRGEIFQIQAAN